MIGLLLEAVEDGDVVFARADSRLALVVDDSALGVAEERLLEGDVLVELETLLPVDAMLCDDPLWPVWSAVEDAVADDGEVEALRPVRSEFAGVALVCVVVVGDDDALGLLAPEVDAARELSDPP